MSAALSLSSPARACLLWLSQFPHQRAAADQPPPLARWSKVRRDRLWQELQQAGLVDFEVTVTRFGLTAAGRVLLQLDTSVLPVTPDEKYVLQSCRDRSLRPEQICARVPCDQRQTIIQNLAQQGLLRITQHQLGAVWLTPAGFTWLHQQGDRPAPPLPPPATINDVTG